MLYLEKYMPNNDITEWALRAAVNQFSSSKADADPTDTIKNFAKERAKNLVLANSDASERTSQLDLQGAAIDLAVKGLVLAFIAVKSQADTMKEQRLSFDKERLAGIATMTIPTNKVEQDLSDEERIIKSYIELINDSKFAKYFGLKTDELSQDHLSYHSVLPFYRMSEGLSHLNQQRALINLFFKSALPSSISNIDQEFTSDNAFTAFFESAWEKENYLNDLRAPRLIMMSLANLLWNLQNPVDTEGLPLSVSERIELCRQARLLLNALLNKNSEPYVHKLNKDGIHLESFIKRVDIHIKGLQEGFIEEKLHTVNVEDVTNSAHRSLRTMDKSVFKLIYRKQQPGKEGTIPDPHAAQRIADTLGYINQLLEIDASLLKPFAGIVELDQSTFVNAPPSTVLDILIIFTHASPGRKAAIYQGLEKLHTESANQLLEQLKIFDQDFIKPILERSEKELDLGLFESHKNTKIAALAAKRIIPLMTLVLEDYRIPVTTHTSSESAHQADSFHSAIRNGDEQVYRINRCAEQKDGYYQWKLSAFLQSSEQFAKHLDELPFKQFRLTKISELLDNLRDVVTHYRSFLAYPSFQRFLKQCINDISEEYNQLERYIDSLDRHLTHDEYISRDFKAILIPMTQEIDDTIHNFNEAVRLLEQKVSSPSFPNEQKKLLQKKVSVLEAQYQELFSKPTGIEDVIDIQNQIPDQLDRQAMPTNTTTTAVPSQMMVSLTRLVTHCQDALSGYMITGHKGELLKDLLQRLERKPNCTRQDIQQSTQELLRIVMAYRQSYFFQASYGETKSAKAFCQQIMKYKNSAEFPLAEFLFGNEHNIDLNSQSEVLAAMKRLGTEQQWQQCDEQLQPLDSAQSVVF